MRRRRRQLWILGPVLVTALVAADLWAGLYEGSVPAVVGAGGRRSLDGVGDMVLEGTAGQPAVGTIQGGGFTLEAGFWTRSQNHVSAAGDVPAAGDRLEPAHPNPFNPATQVSFSLASAGRARLSVYDVRGRRVRVLVDENLPAGRHERTWRGTDDRGLSVASGVYLLRLEAGDRDHLQKITLLK